MCTPYVFIDDSTDQAFEEEEFYQEEEENFNHCTNQGKPPLTMQANPCNLDNPSKDIIHALVILLWLLLTPSIIFQALLPLLYQSPYLFWR